MELGDKLFLVFLGTFGVLCFLPAVLDYLDDRLIEFQEWRHYKKPGNRR